MSVAGEFPSSELRGWLADALAPWDPEASADVRDWSWDSAGEHSWLAHETVIEDCCDLSPDGGPPVRIVRVVTSSAIYHVDGDGVVMTPLSSH